MKYLAACAAIAGLAGGAYAQPIIIEPSSRIPAPPGAEFVGFQTGLDGNEAVIQVFQDIPDGEEGYDTVATAYLYRRNGTTWTLVRQLAEGFDPNEDDASTKYPVAMKDGILVLEMPQRLIFEREGGEWVEKPYRTGAGWGEAPASDIEIDGGRIFVGDKDWGGAVVEKDPATGLWVPFALHGDYSGDSDNAVGGPVDLSPNWAVVADPYNADQLPAPAVHVFQRVPGSGWVTNARLVAQPGHSVGDVAITDSELFTGDYARFGAAVWRRNSAGQWAIADSLRTASDFADVGFADGYTYAHALEKSGPYVFKQGYSADRKTTVVNVFRKDVNGFYRHVAMLVPPLGGELFGSVSISGNGVLVGTWYFELPTNFTHPALFQDTFASGNGAGWTRLPGSQFAVVQGTDSRVFRQSSTAGDAGAVLDAFDWTSQSIQADVRPTAINGSNRWVGLATRRTDASNYYYVALRSSGIIELKRIQGGTFATLDSASVTWALNRTYRLRLESVGTQHRVYVDGALVLEAQDDALSHGRAALLSYRAAADYDNVIVSPHATQTIYSANTAIVWTPPVPNPEPWSYAGGTWQWEEEPGTTSLQAMFRQISTAGDARAVVGPEQIINTDQIVEARVQPRAFASTGDPWFGVMARYANSSNYVYMSLRRSNTLTLRKVVNGSIVQLGSATLTVTPNTWYRLRLEAVGSQLRAYVNGRQMLEATDPQPSIGRVGLVGFRAAADYDDIRAVVP
jgi:hypothetical protein